MNELPDEIYVLYGGDSPDGRGDGVYLGRTADRDEAYAHFLRIKADPFSTGYVELLTPAKAVRMTVQEWKRHNSVLA